MKQILFQINRNIKSKEIFFPVHNADKILQFNLIYYIFTKFIFLIN